MEWSEQVDCQRFEMVETGAAAMQPDTLPEHRRWPRIRWIWLALLLASAVLRLVELDYAPLSPAEAADAWAAYSGDPSSATSGLLLSLNRTLFWMVGASDGVARLAPVVAGTLVPLALIAWLHRFPGVGSLMSAGLLVLSPSMVLFSRTSSGLMIGVSMLLGLMVLLDRHRSAGSRWLIPVTGLVAGLGIASGEGFISLALVAGLALAIVSPRELVGAARGLLAKEPLLAGLGGMLLGSTSFLFQADGLAAVANGLESWLTGFQINPGSAARPLQILVEYELGILFLGASGLVWAFWAGRRFHKWLAVWAILGLLVGTLRPSRADATFVSLVPLALLAGTFLDWTLARSSTRGTLVAGGTAAVVVLAINVLLGLGQYASSELTDPNRARANLLLVTVSIILIAGVTALIWTYNSRAACGSLVGASIILLALFGWGAAWRLGHVHQVDPREVWVEEAAGSGTRLLVDTLETVSHRAAQTRSDLPIVVQAAEDDLLLHWYLRGFARVTWLTSLEQGIDAEAVVTTSEDQSSSLGEEYMGMDFVLRVESAPDPKSASLGRWIGWYLLRDSESGREPLITETAIAWVRPDIAFAVLGLE